MEQEFLQFAVSNGYEITSPQFDGTIHRLGRKKNKWYVGWQNFSTKSGKKYVVAILGDWSTGEKHEFKPAKTNADYSSEDIAAMRAKIAEASKRAEEERAKIREEVATEVEQEWARASEKGRTAYLDRKKISSLFGARTQLGDDGREVLVPCKDIDGKIWGLQRIFPDGKKLFTSGQRTAGTMFQIGELKDDVVICEGYATGCSIHEATGKTVVCAFNAGNLKAVAIEIRKKNSGVGIVIAGDDDLQTEGNPGRTKAEEAARSCGGVAVFPKFTSEEKGTDFNDLFCLDPERVRKVFSSKPQQEEVGFIPLGFSGHTHYFFDKKTKTIVELSSCSDSQMLQIMPLDYWKTIYPGKKSPVDWLSAKDALIRMSQRAGIFDEFRIRGSGVWLDAGRTVVNTGDGVIVDGKKVQSFSSKFVYVQTRNKIETVSENPLSDAETGIIRAACEDLKWKDPKDGYLLAGWIAIARIAGALPIRPHVWLTGSSGSGKSTVMDRVIRVALGGEGAKFYLQGGSTEAGVRQAIKADSIPIIFDEFETTGEGTKERVQNLIELLRQSWSHTQGCVVKGSANGVATQYALSFAALVSSIRIALENDADRSRFTVIELAPHGSDLEHWARYSPVLDLLNEDYGERLFARSVRLLPAILKSYRVMAKVLSGVVSQRFGQQYGMLLAGYYSLMSDEPMTEEVARGMVEELKFSTEKEDAEASTDERDCLEQLLTTRVSGIDGLHRIEMSLGELIQSACSMGASTSHCNVLKSYGIVVDSGKELVYVSNTSAALRRAVFEKTRWSSGWAKSLARLPGATPRGNSYISNGFKSRSIGLPFSYFSK